MAEVPAARLERIVDAAMLLDPESRERFVSSVCAGKTELREAIESEIARRSAGSGPRSKDLTRTMPSSAPPRSDDARPARSAPPTAPSSGAPSSQPPSSDAPLPRGATVGRYVVLDVVGRGAMGVVYAAYDPELDRKVAVKLVRPERSDEGPATGGFARLQREARAIAKVSHPNVIAVHDVGAFGDEVFLAMEYVEGVTLTRWLKDGHSWQDVVDMFLQAGRGLAAAHAAGLVHRDFKPDNVLVGQEGRARVLDFGLARAAEAKEVAVALERQSTAPPVDAPDHALANTVTQSGVFMGTPAYMAPEQLTGSPVDARIDQFSFAVALYEGLYGERPFTGDTLPQLLASLTEGKVPEPPKSSRVPAWVRDVVLRGLRFKAEDRYPSMDALLADLGRDRSRGRKRWLALAALAGSVATAVVAVASAKGAQARVCSGASEKLAGVWDADRKRAVDAAFEKTGKAYAKDAARAAERALDAYAKSWVAMQTDACEATRVRKEQSDELLDLRTECLAQRREELRSLVDVLSRADEKIVQKAVGAVTGLTGVSGCANATALRSTVRPPGDAASRAKVEDVRKTIASAKALRTAGKYPDALPVAERAVAAANELRYEPVQAEAAFELGTVQGLNGDAKLAEKTLNESLHLAESSRHDEAAARAWVGLVWTVGYDEARYDEGLQYERHARAFIERMGGNDDLLAMLMSHVGVILVQEGKYEEGQKQHEQALAIRERLFGPESSEVCTSLNNLGIALMRRGKYEEALVVLQRSQDIRERTLGPSHPDLTMALTNISSVYALQNKLAESLAYDERGLAILERALDPDHPQVGMQLNNMCSTRVSMKAFDAALSDCTRALAIYEKALGPNHPRIAYPLTGIGASLIGTNHPDRAVPVLERAVALRDANTSDPFDKAETYFQLARALRASGGDKKRARALATKARDGYATAGDMGHTELAEIDAWLKSF